MGSEKQEPGAGSGAGEAYAKAAPYLDAAWSLIGSVGVWTGIGLFADSRLHTAPWLVVAGSVGGMALGFYLFFKRLAAADKKARDKKL